jgi:hypothetical protein
MRGKEFSERTSTHAKLDMLIDYYLDDMRRPGCQEDTVSANRRALGRLVHTIDFNAREVELPDVSEEVVGKYVTDTQRVNVKHEDRSTRGRVTSLRRSVILRGTAMCSSWETWRYRRWSLVAKRRPDPRRKGRAHRSVQHPGGPGMSTF